MKRRLSIVPQEVKKKKKQHSCLPGFSRSTTHRRGGACAAGSASGSANWQRRVSISGSGQVPGLTREEKPLRSSPRAALRAEPSWKSSSVNKQRHPLWNLNSLALRRPSGKQLRRQSWDPTGVICALAWAVKKKKKLTYYITVWKDEKTKAPRRTLRWQHLAIYAILWSLIESDNVCNMI